MVSFPWFLALLLSILSIGQCALAPALKPLSSAALSSYSPDPALLICQETCENKISTSLYVTAAFQPVPALLKCQQSNPKTGWSLDCFSATALYDPIPAFHTCLQAFQETTWPSLYFSTAMGRLSATVTTVSSVLGMHYGESYVVSSIYSHLYSEMRKVQPGLFSTKKNREVQPGPCGSKELRKVQTRPEGTKYMQEVQPCLGGITNVYKAQLGSCSVNKNTEEQLDMCRQVSYHAPEHKHIHVFYMRILSHLQ